MNVLFNWFDVVALMTVGLGIWLGRRRGMSAELLDLLMWLAIVILAAQCNPFLGRWITETLKFSAAVCYVMAYLLVAIGVFLVVFLIRRWQGEKLISGDAFGGFEYYLGMIGGVIHLGCILIVVLAILHAPKISEAQIQQQLKHQKEWAGSIFFSPFGQIQQSIFKGSITGRLVTQHLSTLLIEVDPDAGKGSRDTIYRARERLVDEAIGTK
jgi:uncharacterized membrane protein required for colicin V production